MTQLSRPYQVGLAVICLLAAVWFVALRGHSGTGASSTTASQRAASVPAPKATPTAPYHGSAPGVAGLTRAIEKARGAVAQSERNAKQLERKSAEASSSTSISGGTSAPARASAGSRAARAGSSSAVGRGASGGAATRTHSTSRTNSTHAPRPATAHRAPATNSPSQTAGAPALQRAVESKLASGKVVAILFWNPSATVDRVVRSELQAAQRALHGSLIVEQAQATQVGDFGTFTRAVAVLQTPTILLVNPRGQTTSLTGLTDTFSLEQAVAEIEH